MAGTIVGIGVRCDWMVRWEPVTVEEARRMHFGTAFDEATTIGWTFEAWDQNIAPIDDVPHIQRAVPKGLARQPRKIQVLS